MNNEILATPNTGRSAAPSSDSELILIEPPNDVTSILKGMRPVRDDIRLLPEALSQLKNQANYEGVLADRVGIEQNPACNRCRTNTRPFPVCSVPPKMP